MRSVVVVLPASMWATIPMFRILSSDTACVMPSPCESTLPPVMRKRLVRFSHAVRILALLHGPALPGGGIEDLGDQLVHHRPLVFSRPRILDQPAQSEREPPLRPHFDRHLICRPTHAPGPDLEHRHDVVQRLVQNLDRILAGALLDLVESRVHDVLGQALLAPDHELVDEPVHDHAVVHWFRPNLTMWCLALPWHLSSLFVRTSALRRSVGKLESWKVSGRRLNSPTLQLFNSPTPLLGPFGPVLAAALSPFCDTRRIDRPADDVIADARKIRYPAAADQHHGVFLQVMADAGDV